jgi:tetratricopeptide (TPR) repeat protein
VLDPGYALAYSGLADAFSYLGNFNYLEPGDAYRQARVAALKALALDDELAEAHLSLALIRMNHDWDWVSAEKAYRRALDLNPGYASAHSGYAWFKAARGRLDEAIDQMRRTLELDPLSISENANFAWYLYMARRYDAAVEQLRKTLDMEPTDPYAHQLLGRVYEQQAKYSEAVAELREAVARSDDGATELAALGHAYAVAGQAADARQILRQLQGRSEREFVSPYNLAIVYAGLGELEQAIASLDRAYDRRDGWLAGHVNVDPRFDPVRRDPRFQELLRRIGLLSS